MTLRLRKITYLIHVDRIDDDGNVTDEGALAADQHGSPFVAFAHQIDGLAERVGAVVEANQPDDRGQPADG